MTQILLILFLLFTPFTGKTEEVNTDNKIKAPTEVVSNAFWVNIQSKIENAFVQSQNSKSVKPLQQINQKLDKIYTQQPNRTVLYWQAYASYYTAIYYYLNKNNTLAEKTIDKAIARLERLNNKNSEEYAILSLLQGFSIQFKSIFKKMSLGRTVLKNGRLAIKKDKNNLRAYYVLGKNDFYRPERFGGGKVVEKYLKKAISLPTQQTKNKITLSWGKAEAYELLIKWYIKKNKTELAKKYWKKAKKIYPKNQQIKQLLHQ